MGPAKNPREMEIKASPNANAVDKTAQLPLVTVLFYLDGN